MQEEGVGGVCQFRLSAALCTPRAPPTLPPTPHTLPLLHCLASEIDPGRTRLAWHAAARNVRTDAPVYAVASD